MLSGGFAGSHSDVGFHQETACDSAKTIGDDSSAKFGVELDLAENQAFL
jgi:hypothetical protein